MSHRIEIDWMSRFRTRENHYCCALSAGLFVRLSSAASTDIRPGYKENPSSQVHPQALLGRAAIGPAHGFVFGCSAFVRHGRTDVSAYRGDDSIGGTSQCRPAPACCPVCVCPFSPRSSWCPPLHLLPSPWTQRPEHLAN